MVTAYISIFYPIYPGSAIYSVINSHKAILYSPRRHPFSFGRPFLSVVAWWKRTHTPEDHMWGKSHGRNVPLASPFTLHTWPLFFFSLDRKLNIPDILFFCPGLVSRSRLLFPHSHKPSQAPLARDTREKSFPVLQQQPFPLAVFSTAASWPLPS